jgi:hypothetical protein
VEQIVVETRRGVPNLIAVLSDGTGEVDLLFLGRGRVGGIELGAKLEASGTATAHGGRVTIMNPLYEITVAAHHETASAATEVGKH